MSNIKTPGILKKDDIAALRFADDIRLYSDFQSSRYCEVTCTKDFMGSTRTYIFQLPNNVEYLNSNSDLKVKIADITFRYCTKDWELQTIFGNLQEFDELEILWLPNIKENFYEEYGLVFDMLKFIVYRKNKRFHYKVHMDADRLNSSMFLYE